jgi:hypothetical protein
LRRLVQWHGGFVARAVTPDICLRAVKNLQCWLADLVALEVGWRSFTRTLTVKMHDKASELDIDLANAPQAEAALTKEIDAVSGELKSTDPSQRWSKIAKLDALKKKLAALRDLSNVHDWMQADRRAVNREPTSSFDTSALESKIKGCGMSEGELRDFLHQTNGQTQAVVDKVHLLQAEVGKAEDVIRLLRHLEWSPEGAPLTRMLLHLERSWRGGRRGDCWYCLR